VTLKNIWKMCFGRAAFHPRDPTVFMSIRCAGRSNNCMADCL